MEKDNYYIRNEETGKLNIYTTQEYYKSLEEPQRRLFTRYCLFSRSKNCWISKAKLAHSGHLRQKLSELGFEDLGSVGKSLPFAEQVQREKDRAESRAERSDARAQKAKEQSDRLSKQATDMARAIPFGQPILIGHHSEGRDRRYRDRIHNTMGRSVKEEEKAAYYEDKAESARQTASGEKYKNQFYLSNRIKENKAAIRRLERSLKGKLYPDSPEREVREEERKLYTEQLLKVREKLDFYVGRMRKIIPDYEPDNRNSNKEKKSNRLK